jgi:hypothetical protein
MCQRELQLIEVRALIAVCAVGCGLLSGCMEYEVRIKVPRTLFTERLPSITQRLLDEAEKLQFGIVNTGRSLGYLQFCLESRYIGVTGKINSNYSHYINVSSYEQESDKIVVIDGYVGDDGLQAAWLFFTQIPRMSIRTSVTRMEEAVKAAVGS